MTRIAARIVLLLTLAAVSAPAAANSESQTLNATLKAIENRYNHAESLKLDFSETYIATGHPSRTESGVLYLRKPRRMRWEYTAPAGKVFIADGKDTWSYVPDDHRVEKRSLKMSEDMRAPLAFLLGKLDFSKDFKSWRALKDPDGSNWIAALPKSGDLPYNQVDFEATPDGQIHKIRVTNQNLSKLEYAFSNEQLNAPVTPGLFVFHPPADVQVLEDQP